MVELLPLDACAREPGLAGAKAAGLAAAAEAGFPVVPGWVVPADALAPALAAGVAALRRSPAAARLAVAGTPVDPVLAIRLRAACARYRHGAIVRSSSTVEADGEWAGAFSTYHQVEPDHLVTALLGCAASVFSRDVLGRCDAIRLPPGAVRLAVLVQPWLRLDGGGTAVVAPDGVVSVTGLRGDPAGLVAGERSGARAVVEPDGTVRGDRTVAGLGPVVADDVAALARALHAAQGDEAIEWGIDGGRLWLLQARRGPASAASPPDAGGSPARPARRASPIEVRLARLAQRYPAPQGDLLVLPWGLAVDSVPEATPIAVDDPATALPEILTLAAELRAAAWGSPADVAAARWTETARAVLGDVLGCTMPPRLAGLRAPDPAVADRLLGLMEGLGRALAARGSLPHPRLVWRLTLRGLEQAASHAGARPAVPQGPDRWAPFVAAVIEANGSVTTGVPVASGASLGRVHALLAGMGRPSPRSVLVAARPVPQIAPLLWGSAALVTGEGSDGAHLFEVARSLGVPAVTGVDVEGLGTLPSDALVAVDGDRGAVSVLEGAMRRVEMAGAGA